MRTTAIMLVCLLAGCAGTRQVTDLNGFLPQRELWTSPEKKEGPLAHHQTVDAVLRHYFTDEAYELIKDIPLIDGPAFAGYAAGTTFISNLASLFSFNGWGRKVILPGDVIRTQWGVESIIHEYVHHVDDMCRDGESKLLDYEEFGRAFYMLERDFTYAWLAINTNRKLQLYPFFYDAILSIGPESEEIAFTASQVAIKQQAPDYLWRVFRRVLRRQSG